MNGIQLLLILGVSLLGIFYITRLRKTVVDLIVFALLLISAISFIIWPELTTRIANFLGVGRGADLLYYICILLFSFALMKLYARIRKLEQQFTKLIREDALKQDRG